MARLSFFNRERFTEDYTKNRFTVGPLTPNEFCLRYGQPVRNTPDEEITNKLAVVCKDGFIRPR